MVVDLKAKVKQFRKDYNGEALVVFSGGQDSTTCLFWTRNRFKKVQAITFKYGQRHEQEIIAAKGIAGYLDVPHLVVDLGNLFRQVTDSLLLEQKGDIGEKHALKPSLPASFVPNRNLIFLTLAHAYAQKLGFKNLVTGVCQTDYSGYPDCRLEVIKLLESVLNLGSESDIRIHTPLMHLTKAQTFKLASDEGGLETVLKDTHTCYNNSTMQNEWGRGCGTCPACLLRKKGYLEFEAMNADL